MSLRLLTIEGKTETLITGVQKETGPYFGITHCTGNKLWKKISILGIIKLGICTKVLIKWDC